MQDPATVGIHAQRLDQTFDSDGMWNWHVELFYWQAKKNRKRVNRGVM